MITCFDIASYFLDLANDDDYRDLISNMKLQKLVYYAQGFYLAKYNQPLFNSAIEAWSFGPVIPELYHEFKKYGSEPIPTLESMKINFSIYDDKTKEILDAVYMVFGQYSAWRLSQLTHEELPWINGSKRADKIIQQEDMRKYFITRLE
jgi:uncharacterized phage-associated protein